MTDGPRYIPASEYLARQARTELHAHLRIAEVPVVPGHGFETPLEDAPEVCLCGAAFFEGYNLHAVKLAHLEAVAR